MNDEQLLDPKRRCPEMIIAGINDPDSQAGIDFCIESCPYDYCVMLETIKKSLRYAESIRIEKGVRVRGVSLDDIALVLRKSKGSVRGYLKKSA